jgi:uncharacterized small protein (DUF1192 family)
VPKLQQLIKENQRLRTEGVNVGELVQQIDELQAELERPQSELRTRRRSGPSGNPELTEKGRPLSKGHGKLQPRTDFKITQLKNQRMAAQQQNFEKDAQMKQLKKRHPKV